MGCHFTELHCRSDGWAAHFKNLQHFGDLSRFNEDLGIPITWSYSAAGHGKGEVDSAAGVIKTKARSAAVTHVDDVVIQSTQNLTFCENHFNAEMQQTSSGIHGRRFFEVKKG